MKRKLVKKILFVILALLIFSLIVILVIKNNRKTIAIDNYVIHYYLENNIYDIETKKNNIYVNKREIVYCIKAPCPTLDAGSFKVEYTDEYVNFIEGLFKDKDIKELTIIKEELSDEESSIMSSIVKDN